MLNKLVGWLVGWLVLGTSTLPVLFKVGISLFTETNRSERKKIDKKNETDDKIE